MTEKHIRTVRHVLSLGTGVLLIHIAHFSCIFCEAWLLLAVTRAAPSTPHVVHSTC